MTGDSRMTGQPSVVSLFDVAEVETMPRVRDIIVGPVSSADVREFARRYHYAQVEGSATWRWGLWDGPVLHGVVSYNMPTRRACQSIFGAEHFDKVWHMGRLILSDDSPRNSESRLIGGSLRAIERDYPHIWAVLTFADTTVGHIGIVYQATNAIYTGSGGNAIYYTDAAGNRRSPKCHSGWLSQERVDELGLTRHRGGVKHRYVYILGSKTRRRHRRALLKLPVLPYPKRGAA